MREDGPRARVLGSPGLACCGAAGAASRVPFLAAQSSCPSAASAPLPRAAETRLGAAGAMMSAYSCANNAPSSGTRRAQRDARTSYRNPDTCAGWARVAERVVALSSRRANQLGAPARPARTDSTGRRRRRDSVRARGAAQLCAASSEQARERRRKRKFRLSRAHLRQMFSVCAQQNPTSVPICLCPLEFNSRQTIFILICLSTSPTAQQRFLPTITMRQASLFDPKFERAACGVGFIVNINGQASRKVSWVATPIRSRSQTALDRLVMPGAAQGSCVCGHQLTRDTAYHLPRKQTALHH